MPVNISGNGSITGLTDLAEPTEINSGSNDLVLKAHGAESLKCTSTETIFDKKVLTFWSSRNNLQKHGDQNQKKSN